MACSVFTAKLHLSEFASCSKSTYMEVTPLQPWQRMHKNCHSFDHPAMLIRLGMSVLSHFISMGGVYCDTDWQSISWPTQTDNHSHTYQQFRVFGLWIQYNSWKKPTHTLRAQPASGFKPWALFAQLPPTWFDPVGRTRLIYGSGFGPGPLSSLRFGWVCAGVCFFVERPKPRAKYTLYSPPLHLIILSLCMCVSVVAGVMAGLGRHSSLSKRVCFCVCEAAIHAKLILLWPRQGG